MQHIVKKQILEFELDNKLDAFCMQQDMAGCYQYEILPVLEKVFNELSDDETIIEIDRLEIDLGLITDGEIKKKSIEDLYTTISLKVREAAGNIIKEKQHSAPHTVHSVANKSKVLSIARQWLFYMEHGYLAWNTISINETWYNQVLEAFAVDFESTAVLRRLIVSDQRAAMRIIYQHKEIFLQQLIEILTAEKQTDLLLLIDELTGILALEDRVQNKIRDNKIKIARERVWIVLLTLAASAENKLTSQKKITEQAIRQILKEDPVMENIIPSPREKEVTEVVHQADDNGIFVQYAGIVLLHPFLPSFFKRLQLTEQAGFISAMAHQKAVFMLHYLSTGHLVAEEHELVIPKLLCGFSIEETIPKHIEIDEQEMAEANNLLEAAIAQWEILKNTSAAGLREGFLQRNGKLYSKNDTLYLQMETKSIDIVLDYLPWSLGIIKLPWMKELLRVDWR